MNHAVFTYFVTTWTYNSNLLLCVVCAYNLVVVAYRLKIYIFMQPQPVTQICNTSLWIHRHTILSLPWSKSLKFIGHLPRYNSTSRLSSSVAGKFTESKTSCHPLKVTLKFEVFIKLYVALLLISFTLALSGGLVRSKDSSSQYAWPVWHMDYHSVPFPAFPKYPIYRAVHNGE